jgi:hypothetical protein
MTLATLSGCGRLGSTTCSLDTLSSLSLFPYIAFRKNTLFVGSKNTAPFFNHRNQQYPHLIQIVALEIPFSLSPLNSIPVLSTIRPKPAPYPSATTLSIGISPLLHFRVLSSVLEQHKDSCLHWADETNCIDEALHQIDIYDGKRVLAAYGTELFLFASGKGYLQFASTSRDD